MSSDPDQSCDDDFRTESIAEYWNQQASSYDEEFDHTVGSPAEQVAWNRILDIVTGGRNRLDVLDAGTGTGFLALALASRGHSVVGIDLSPEMLVRARRNAAEQRLDAVFELGDAERPDFAAETFDLVISRHVFWGLTNRAAALTAWFRLLRRDGYLAILDGDWDAGDPAESNAPASGTAESVRAIVAAHGYVDVCVDELGDLSDALDARAAQGGHSIPRYARYLVWGRREEIAS
jgi:SAM-dependent methyltransferase